MRMAQARKTPKAAWGRYGWDVRVAAGVGLFGIGVLLQN